MSARTSAQAGKAFQKNGWRSLDICFARGRATQRLLHVLLRCFGFLSSTFYLNFEVVRSVLEVWKTCNFTQNPKTIQSTQSAGCTNCMETVEKW